MNLSNAPQEFVSNKIINNFINQDGIDKLPVIMLDDEIVISGRYPTTDEFIQLLELPEGLLNTDMNNGECCCEEEGGCC